METMRLISYSSEAGAFAAGGRVVCGMPGNDFPLQDDARPVVLIAGGIGITPIKAMAHELQADGRKIALH